MHFVGNIFVQINHYVFDFTINVLTKITFHATPEQYANWMIWFILSINFKCLAVMNIFSPWV